MTLNAGQFSERRIVGRGEQIREGRERELGFGLGWPCDQNAKIAAQSLVDDRRPDRRLTDPRFACQEKSARRPSSFRKEAVRFGELPLATDYDAAHPLILIDRGAKV